MKQLVWVHREFFDTSLDRTTWVEMALALREREVATTMICSFEHSPEPLDGFESVVWLPPCGPGIFRRVRFLVGAGVAIRAAARECVDYAILDVQTAVCALPWDIRRKCLHAGPRVIMDLRTFDFSPDNLNAPGLRLRDLASLILTKCALRYGRVFHCGLTAINPRLRDVCVIMGGHPATAVWGSGFSIRRPPAEAQEWVRDLRDWIGERFCVGYHGALWPNRGLRTALESVLAARGGGADIAVVLLGDGPFAAELREYVGEHNAASWCRLLPPVPHDWIGAFLGVVDLGLMLYPDLRYWDFNHPIKLVEFLGHGVPVLCSDIPVFSEQFADCDGIFLVPPEAADQAGAVLADLAAEPARVAAAGSAAAQYAESYLDWGTQADRLLAFLEGLAERREGAGM